jgi:hypothetical protein
MIGQQTTDLLNSVFQIIYLGSFLFFMVYGQKFQTWIMLREIRDVKQIPGEPKRDGFRREL